MLKAFFVIVALAITVEMVGQAALSPYTQWITGGSKASKTEVERRRVVRRTKGTGAVSEPLRMRAFMHVDVELDRGVLAQHGVAVAVDYDDILSVELPLDSMDVIASVKGVHYIEVGQPAYPEMSQARALGGVDEAHEGVELPHPFTGKGVVVGVVDAGFEYGHPHLYSADKREYRVKRVWNMNDSGGQKLPYPYNVGAHYTTKAEILAAGYDTQVKGETHGMHVVGIAAGADRTIEVQGVAPESDIVLVVPDDDNTSSSHVDISDGINYIYEHARAEGKPAVVNVSWGSWMGPHDGTSTFDRVCERLTGKGRLLVGSAGNSGNRFIHLKRNFATDGTALRSVLEFNDPKKKVAVVDAYGDATNDFMVDISLLRSDGSVISTTPAVQGRKSGSVLKLLTGEAEGSVELISGIDRGSNKGRVLVVVALESIEAGNVVSIRFTPVANGVGEVNAWSGQSTFVSKSLPGHVDGDANSTVSEIGGTGKSVITVGAFMGRKRYKSLDGSAWKMTQEVGELCAFSAKGPTVDGRIKPDVCAPGSMLISSYSRVAADPSLKNYYMVTNSVDMEGTPYYYGVMQGTSMAAPYVAGVLALWLEADPELDPQKALDIIKATTRKDEQTGTVGDAKSPQWGYGKIDAASGLAEVLKRKDEQLYEGGLPVVAYMPRGVGEELQVVFLVPVSGVRMKLYTAEGRLVKMNQQAEGGPEPIRWALPGMARGLYMLRVETDQGERTIKIVIPSRGE